MAAQEQKRLVIHMFYIDGDGDDPVATLEVSRHLGVLWLNQLWVESEHRKQGLATLLLLSAIETYGHEALYLNVAGFAGQPVCDEALVRFYSHHGFAKTDVPGVMIRSGTRDV